MKKIFFLLPIASVILFFSCKKTNPEPPVPQNIVTVDTSAFTGELGVQVYYAINSNYYTAPAGMSVELFAAYEDIQTGLSIYNMATNSSGLAYFGFINYGNYYVRASGNINNVFYKNVSVVQVRPRRQELLNITMYP